ncbi:prolyl oligopeptidase family serine peptidase [Aquimarina litoralis]|uniref:prolyl oligopeptidase family serine peptidase n=1 Tax=Aquimarina litoralis TaxID=584605 RepID=UPI001C59F062|nr:prolyl oligopeptidase family serine peptidase [Aquimarina litoralis]MBW1297801.1 prolyl oligopeptidase family serine peptidase [Aquimarina litoralis]
MKFDILKSLSPLLTVTILCIGCTEKVSFRSDTPVIEEHHGQVIEDYYRSLEDLKNPKVLDWIKTENENSKNYLARIDKTSYLVDQQLEYEKSKSFSVTKLEVTESEKYFYLKSTASENVASLFFRKSFDAPEKLLFSPKEFRKEDQKEYVINYIKPSWDGNFIVVSITEKGKEISKLIIIDVIKNEVLPIVLKNSWVSEIGGVTWLPDNSGFIYIYHPVINKDLPDFLKNTKSVIYKLHKDENSLVEVFSKNHNPDLGIEEADFPKISLKGSGNDYFVGEKWGVGKYNDAYIIPTDKIEQNNWRLLFKKEHQVKEFIISKDTIYFSSSKNAPNFEIRKTSILNPNFENATIVVKQKKDTIITDFEITSEGLFYVTSKNGVKADLFKVNNVRDQQIKMPNVFGHIALSSRSISKPELSILTRGWLTPSKRYQYTTNEGLIEKDLNPVADDLQIKDIIIDEVEVTAHDGEQIPLSLIYNKNSKLDGSTPLMMDGYGAYGSSRVPVFSLRKHLWIQEGGIYAIAHVRGGGEKGDAWHKGGFKNTKENTWKDFISCGDYLVANKYTSPSKLAVWSGSAGGIMIGRAIIERPELFKAAIVEFGSLNTLRSESRPNGANNTKEFGSIKDSLEFRGLMKMDAFYNLKEGVAYPSTFLTAGINDPRLPAWFTLKFAAKMEDFNISENPNLLLIDFESGHGIDDTKLKEFERFANILSYAFWQTGHPDYQLKE